MSAKSSITIVNELISHAVTASLGTHLPGGSPFVSFVSVAAIDKLQVVMLLSGLAQHTKNLIADPRCSLLIVGQTDSGADPMTVPRVSLVGQMTQLPHSDDQAARKCLLGRHPSAAMYAGLGDFSIFQFKIETAHLVAGFGRIQTFVATEL